MHVRLAGDTSAGFPLRPEQEETMSQSVDAAMSRERGEEKGLIEGIRGETGKWETKGRVVMGW